MYILTKNLYSAFSPRGNTLQWKRQYIYIKYRYRSLSDRSVKTELCRSSSTRLGDLAAGSEKHWGGKRSVELGWGCVLHKECAHLWFHKEGVGSKGVTLRLTRRELVDWQLGSEDVGEDASRWVTMGSWQGRGQVTQGGVCRMSWAKASCFLWASVETKASLYENAYLTLSAFWQN